MDILELLQQHRAIICENLYLGRAHWDELLDRIERSQNTEDFADEQIWTFLLSALFSLSSDGPSKLAKVLSGEAINSKQIWFEVLPSSPRIKEGRTHLDLALGDIQIMDGTDSGIVLADVKKPAIIFCEFKWYSDLSITVTHSLHRNQLARVIENGLYFKTEDGRLVDNIHVCLVSPAQFKERNNPSRFYHYKFRDYNSDSSLLVEDLEAEELLLDPDNPNVNEVISNLKLHWHTYEDLFRRAPESKLKTALLHYIQLHAGENQI